MISRTGSLGCERCGVAKLRPNPQRGQGRSVQHHGLLAGHAGEERRLGACWSSGICVHGNKLTMDWVPMHDLDVQVFFIFQIFITLGVNWFSPPGNKG